MSLFPASSEGFISMDTTKVVHTFSDDNTSTAYAHCEWTATQNCVIAGYIVHDSATETNTTSFVKINGVYAALAGLFINGVNSNSYSGVFAFVKKGQTVSITSYKALGLSTIKAYDISYQ